MSFKMFTISPNVRTIENIVLTFGKWKGCKFYNTPVTYQGWLMSQAWFVEKYVTYKK